MCTASIPHRLQLYKYTVQLNEWNLVCAFEISSVVQTCASALCYFSSLHFIIRSSTTCYFAAHIKSSVWIVCHCGVWRRVVLVSRLWVASGRSRRLQLWYWWWYVCGCDTGHHWGRVNGGNWSCSQSQSPPGSPVRTTSNGTDHTHYNEEQHYHTSARPHTNR